MSDSQAEYIPITDSSREMHKAFAAYWGEENSCTSPARAKVKYSEQAAYKAAAKMTAKNTDGKLLEAYPCPFCEFWHIGRAMTFDEILVWSNPDLRDRIPPRISEWEKTGKMKHHAISLCEGRPCTIHNPSDHHMKDWPIIWRWDRYPLLAERQCPHGTGHPDPDHMAWLKTWMKEEDYEAEGIHGCDGCCRTPEEMVQDQEIS